MIEVVPLRLSELPEEAVEQQPAAGSWSAKEELGHLLDSAIMNHVRFMRVLTEANPTLAGYDGDFCVEAHDYRNRDWRELIETWFLLNAHFLMAAEKTSAEYWK